MINGAVNFLLSMGIMAGQQYLVSGLVSNLNNAIPAYKATRQAYHEAHYPSPQNNQDYARLNTLQKQALGEFSPLSESQNHLPPKGELCGPGKFEQGKDRLLYNCIKASNENSLATFFTQQSGLPLILKIWNGYTVVLPAAYNVVLETEYAMDNAQYKAYAIIAARQRAAASKMSQEKLVDSN